MFERRLRIRRTVRYISLAALLLVAVFFAEPFWKAMQVRFEQTHIEQVLRQIARACDGLLIEAVALDQTRQLAENLAGNPAACLDEAGLSSWDYRGDFAAPTVIPAGSWGYATDSAALVYRIKNIERVINLNPVAEELHFKLRTEFADVNQNGSQDSDEYITGLLLESVHEYRWRGLTSD